MDLLPKSKFFKKLISRKKPQFILKFTFSRCLFDNGIQSKCYRMKPSHFLEYSHPYLEKLSEEPKIPKHQKTQFKILMDLNLLKSCSTNTEFGESPPLLTNTPSIHQKTPKTTDIGLHTYMNFRSHCLQRRWRRIKNRRNHNVWYPRHPRTAAKNWF